MDVIIHILLVALIGIFFFLDKYSTSFNPMFFVVIFSILGFVLIQSSDVELIDYNTVQKVNSTHVANPSVNLNDVGVGLFTVQSFIVLVYWFTFILGSVNIMLGRKESQKRND